MGYSTRTDIENIIAQALTSATASTPDGLSSVSSLLNVGISILKFILSPLKICIQ